MTHYKYKLFAVWLERAEEVRGEENSDIVNGLSFSQLDSTSGKSIVCDIYQDQSWGRWLALDIKKKENGEQGRLSDVWDQGRGQKNP